MKTIWQCLLLVLIVFSCNTTHEQTSIFSFVPEEAQITLHVNSTENLESNLSNNSFLKTLSKSDFYKKIAKRLKPLISLNSSQPVIISFLKDSNDSIQFTFATKQTPSLLTQDSLSPLNIEPITIEKHPAHQVHLKKEKLYVATKDSIVFGSSKKSLVSLLLKNAANRNIERLKQVIDTSKSVSVIINHKRTPDLKSVFCLDTLAFKTFADYSIFDVDITQNQILFNGITKANDSTKSFITVFKNTIPQYNSVSKITPSNHDGFISYTFDDFATFKTNLNAFNNKQDSIQTLPNLFDNIQELGLLFENNNTSIVLKSIDQLQTKDALISEQNKIETYRQIDLYNFSKSKFFYTHLSPILPKTEINFYCNIDSFFVFASKKEDLENIIANYQNRTTFSEQYYYKDLQSHLSDASSILQVVNPNLLERIITNTLNSTTPANLKAFKASAVQYIYDTNYAHFNAVIQKSKKKAVEKSVTELLNIKLEAELLNVPQFVTNSRTKTKDIVVQDINNTLYLISNSRNIIWKKQLKGPILGSIKQLDYFKNGQLQLAFATPNKVHLISRKGNYISGFPLKFNDKITQPLAVFDYDNNKKYRLFVTQDNNVLVYDKKGKGVKGFNFKSAKSPINHEPQHFRIKGKDYIVIKTDKNIHILNRRGKTRVQPKSQLQYSNQPVFNHKNKFTTTTKSNNLVTIDANGNVSTNKNTSPFITASSKTLVFLNDNKLNIKNKTIELDFGNYTAPKLFYINNKIYVSVTDLQTQKVLLFDSQTKMIDNFPVYGNSTIDLDNIDNDKNLEFVTKGENNSILVYRIN